MAARNAEATRTIAPAPIMGTAPTRSTTLPTSGANANMPRVCAEMMLPTRARSKPLFSTWIGVAVMIRTITSWPMTIAASANCTGRRENTTLAAGGTSVRFSPKITSSTTASIDGSGRKATRNRARASDIATEPARYPPAYSDVPISVAIRPAGSRSRGPTTAPIVPAHTTRLNALPRRSGLTRSAAV